jgi:hypothetical protein
MDSALIFGWTMWGVFLIATIIYWLEIGFDILSEVNIFLSDAFRALACTLVTSWFLLVPEWNKLHLFWLALLIVMVTDCIEYRRFPALVRIMRRAVGRQPIKHTPSPTIAWSYGRRSRRGTPALTASSPVTPSS